MQQRPGRRAPPLQKCLHAHGAGQRDVLRRRTCHQPVPPTRQAISSRPHSPSVGTAVTLPGEMLRPPWLLFYEVTDVNCAGTEQADD